MGGQGSGRPMKPENVAKKFSSPAPVFEPGGLTFPPTAHIKEEALNRSDVDISGGGGATELNDLSDVSYTTTTDGAILKWNNTAGVFEEGNINDIQGTLSVSDGGTGTASGLTSGELLVGNGFSPVTTIAKTSIDHDALTNFVANEHIDWTSDQGATNINNANITGLPVANTQLTAGTNISLSTNTLNVDDAFLKNDEADTGVGLTLTQDNSSADTQFTPQVLYNTDATPPTASNFPIGTIYIQYTA